jgi:isoquinoline 1-oxidoreductase beta subunit
LEIAMNPMRMRPRTEIPPATIDRRVFLKVAAAAGAGLTLGIWTGAASGQASSPGKTIGSATAGVFEPNAFLTVGRDNVVTVVVKHLEMGQIAH